MTPAFTREDLIACYRRGVFPMADSREDEGVFLIDPPRRGVLPLDGFHLPRRLARTLRSEVFQVSADIDFPAVVAACAPARPGREATWINAAIERMYGDLHTEGLAHSVEVRRDGVMVGGLYGVSIGGAFFGESMFSTARDASKVALAHLVARLIAGGYRLLDTQFLTDHLTQFGAVEISRAEYHRRLARALAASGEFHRFKDGGGEVVQLISQTS
jgi:leucyl/phenylalanyl-tRNA--protein transferase